MADLKERTRLQSIYTQSLLELRDVEQDSRVSLLKPDSSLNTLQITHRELDMQVQTTVNAWTAYEPILASDKDEFEKESRDFRANRRAAINLLKEIADKIQSITPQQNPTQNVVPVRHNSMPVPKFEPITIPTFDGDLSQWMAFWDIFNSMVHSRSDMDEVVKFTTLRTHLKGRAFKTIEGVAVTNANYQGVVTLLKKRFGNPDRLRSSLIREFQNLPAPHYTYSELLNFKLSFEKLITQMQEIDPVDTSSRFFIEILTSKLPAEAFKSLAKKFDTTQFEYKQISEGLDDLIDLMEMCTLQPHSTPRAETKNISTTDLKVGTHEKRRKSDVVGSANQKGVVSSIPVTKGSQRIIQCVFCGNKHSSKFCDVYNTLDQRHQRVRALKLCFSCLKSGHFSTQCSVKPECRFCNSQSHHTFLCAKLCQPGQNPVKGSSRNTADQCNTNTSNSVSMNQTVSPNDQLRLDKAENSNEDLVSSNTHTNPTPSNTPSTHSQVNISTVSSVINSVPSVVSVALPTAYMLLSGGGKRSRIRAFFLFWCSAHFYSV